MQSEFVLCIGVQQLDLLCMEKGEYRVSLDMLFKIFVEFDVGIGEFFDEVVCMIFIFYDVQFICDVWFLFEQDQQEIEEFIGFKCDCFYKIELVKKVK